MVIEFDIDPVDSTAEKGDVGEKLKSLYNREKICQSFTNVPKVLLLKGGF